MVAAERSAAVQRFLESKWPTFLSHFESMVRINSYSFNAEGVNALGLLTASVFEPLGFTAEYVQAADARLGRHLIMRRSGPGPRIGLISHLDTVFPEAEEVRNNFAWRPVGDRIYGPGTVDIKGGTIVALMTLAAVEAIFPERFAAIDWCVLLNAGEEVLAPDFGALAARTLTGARAALVFESGPFSGGVGQLVVARKGRVQFAVEATGRSAHAGIAHEKGVSAIHQLSLAVPAIEAITDYDHALSCSIGTIRGGDSVNTVPARAELEGEMRAFDPLLLERGVEQLEAIAALPTIKSAYDGFEATLRVTVGADQPPWPENEQTAQLFTLWQQMGATLGYTLAAQARGGLSDGNRLWNIVPTLDGLGPAGANLHCSEQGADATKEQEYVLVDSMIPKALLNCLSIVELSST